MRTDPGIAYLCGPMALKNLLLSEHYSYQQIAFLDEVRPGPHGVTLKPGLTARNAGEASPTTWYTARPSSPCPCPRSFTGRCLICGDCWRRREALPPYRSHLRHRSLDYEVRHQRRGGGYFLVPEKTPMVSWREATPRKTASYAAMGNPAGLSRAPLAPATPIRAATILAEQRTDPRHELISYRTCRRCLAADDDL
jgi:hypothetical protein